MSVSSVRCIDNVFINFVLPFVGPWSSETRSPERMGLLLLLESSLTNISITKVKVKHSSGAHLDLEDRLTSVSWPKTFNVHSRNLMDVNSIFKSLLNVSRL